ncbi:MAG: NAD-dependent epimerase/dehydratase family protein [Pedosphaera sp.]|nr:NAD-dependent epimerase/dehydratase family protein [Pedosphaera sp.]
MDSKAKNVFVTGGTGYLGRELIPQLLARGCHVRVLVRAGSEKKLPSDCEVVTGDALDGKTFGDKISPAETFVQLVGVPHPNPSKAKEFRAIDLVSVRESVAVAAAAGIRHFVYLSVAQPGPVMREYIAVRAEGEAMIRASGMSATFVRPYYVLGPGHWWPYFILPIFWAFELFHSKRAAARRLKPVTLAQTLAALVRAVEQPPEGVRIIEAEEMRRA